MTYRAVLVGCGPRGAMHAQGFRAHPARFELTAVCDLSAERAAALAARLGVDAVYTDAEAMVASQAPDVLCFATPPSIRLPLVELGLRHGVRAIVMEKPMALTLAEARRIADRSAAAGVKLVVCHQLKFAAHWRRARELVSSGAIGALEMLHATGRPSMLRVGTHLVDAMLWLNGGHRIVSVIGQVHGDGGPAGDHPGPDHVMGLLEFANGARGLLECGTLAPRRLADAEFWDDAALTAYGTHGYVRTVLGGGWQAITRASGGAVVGGAADRAPQEPRLVEALADWLDDPSRGHPCDGETSYHGLEALLALPLSSRERRRIDLPLASATAA